MQICSGHNKSDIYFIENPIVSIVFLPIGECRKIYRNTFLACVELIMCCKIAFAFQNFFLHALKGH